MKYDFDVLYAPGEGNPAGPLSRLHSLAITEEGFVKLHDLHVSSPDISPSIMERIIKGHKANPFYTSQAFREHLERQHGLLFENGRACSPDDAELKELILREHHEAPYSGHNGMKRHLDAISRV